LLEICHTGYQPDIKDMRNGYQEEICQISIKDQIPAEYEKISSVYTKIIARYQWTVVKEQQKWKNR